MAPSDQIIRDDLRARLLATTEIIGHEPDIEDIRQCFGGHADALEVEVDRVRDVYLQYIAAQMVGG